MVVADEAWMPRTARQVLVRLAGALGSLALLGLIGVAVAAPAAAHARLIETSPAAGARLAVAPHQVELRFDEPVQLTSVSVRVFDAQARDVAVGETEHPDGDPSRATVGLRTGLGSGGYLVSWRVVSADTHPVHGAFTFTVGDAPELAVAASADDPGVLAAIAVARWLQYAGLALLLGGGLFIALCWPAGSRDRTSAQLLTAGAGLITAGALVAFAAEGPLEEGAGLTALADAGLLARTLDGSYGRTLLLRVVLAILTLVLYRIAAPRSGAQGRARWLPWAAPAIPALALVATFAGTGHAAVDPLSPLTELSVAAHLLAACAWIGGLVVLATRLLPARHRDGLLPAAARFAVVAVASVATIVATGVLQSWRGLQVFPALWTTTYGLLILGKVALLAVLVGLALTSRQLVRRGIAGRASTDTITTDGRWTLRRSVSAELASGVVVLALTAVLTGTAPGTDTYVGTVDSTLPLPGAGIVHVLVSPLRAGDNDVRLVLRNSAGQPHDFPEVDASFSELDRDVGPLPLVLRRTDVGSYRATADVPFGGDWHITVTVRTSEVDVTAASTDVPVR